MGRAGCGAVSVRWRNRLTHVQRWGEQQTILEQDADGRIDYGTVRQRYDARERPWYQAAMALGPDEQMAWTTPYTFFYCRGQASPPPFGWGRWPLGSGGQQDGVLGFRTWLADLVPSAHQRGRMGWLPC